MKKRKSSILLLTVIILLIIALHNKLHSGGQPYDAEENTTDIQTKHDIDYEQHIFPAAIYRLVEIAL
ncbi:MAG: hypothetical protein J0I84_11435 [Terrimonas sp.]|nr:hypothetical protein [Terrimonas sp.]OJY90861.1 MAG: hypothetical protein BGP13_12710 [Sphingobacteriales bacterium 40-81]